MTGDLDAKAGAGIDAAEVAKFERLATQWWDPGGKFRPLHKFNPVRLRFLRDTIVAHFGCDPVSAAPLAGLDVLDIGCGGGLLSEPMARLGATTTGVDPAAANVEVARLHAARSGLNVTYRAADAMALAGEGKAFDVVLAMEVVEHVPDRNAFVAACAALVRPGGLLVMATISRTPKAYALAIFGAERVLRWLPRGTHEYGKLVRPAELEASMRDAGLSVVERAGVTYSPITDSWSLSTDTDVNYMMVAERAPALQPQTGA